MSAALRVLTRELSLYEYRWPSLGIGWEATIISVEWPKRYNRSLFFVNSTKIKSCARLIKGYMFCWASVVLLAGKRPVQECMPMGVMRVYIQQMEQDAMLLIQITELMVVMTIRCLSIMSVPANMVMVDMRNNTVYQHAKHEEQERKSIYPSGKIHPSTS